MFVTQYRVRSFSMILLLRCKLKENDYDVVIKTREVWGKVGEILSEKKRDKKWVPVYELPVELA